MVEIFPKTKENKSTEIIMLGDKMDTKTTKIIDDYKSFLLVDTTT